MAEGRRGVVIGNCQAQPLSFTLNFFSRDISFDAYGIHVLPAGKRLEMIEQFVEGARTKYDLVLTAPLSDLYGLLATDRVRETFPAATVITIPNFYFSGLHPDLTYLGGLGQRVLGPLGDYHSKIAVAAFARDIPLDRLPDYFTEKTYAEARYFDDYRDSFAEMRRRDSEIDVPFSDELEVLLKQDLCFFSVNHPTSVLFGHFADKLSRLFAERGLVQRVAWPPRSSALPNQLGTNHIFPVYPEIAAGHGLPFEGNYVFKPAAGPGLSNAMELREFLAREYECFEQVGKDKVKQSVQVGNILAQIQAAF
jgi:hypothetical protein